MNNLIFSCIESRVDSDQSLYGCFKLGPFYSNQGLTIATALRRVLLSDLEGLAIVFLKIEGVKHEYSILKGVQESVLEILSNLKQIQFRSNKMIYTPQVAFINTYGPKVVYANDIQLPGKIQCINPSQYIATISCDGQLKIKLFICQGKRYCLQDSIKLILQKQFINILNINFKKYLFLDSIFLPINKVNFTIQDNPILSKEFIIFEVWTKGSLHPRQSLYKAINQIIQTLIPFRRVKSWRFLSKSKPYIPIQQLLTKNTQNNKYKKILNKISSIQFKQKLLTLDISNLNLSLPTYLYLKKIKINTISDLLYRSINKPSDLKIFQQEFINDIQLNFLNLKNE